LIALQIVVLTQPSLPEADKVTPGVTGFLVMFALAAVTLVLIRSMVGHLRKVRYSPEPPDPDAASMRTDAEPATAGPVVAAAEPDPGPQPGTAPPS
jgi:hypothetical protein